MSELPGKPLIISRDEHTVSRKKIDPDCLKVMRRLNSSGFQAFLVGGGERDILLNKKPKDFDVSTNAKPEEVRRLFRNSRTIGRRFKLNHIYFKGGKIIEVSTFRKSSDQDSEDGKDNNYGDAQTDAFRRDLTINGLFYDLSDFQIIDYIGGIKDIKSAVVRIIGDPDIRFKEDPVRMIRAVRHAARAGFKIIPKTRKSICKNAGLILEASEVRVYEEFIKDLKCGSSWVALQLYSETGLLEHVFSTLNTSIKKSSRQVWERLDLILKNIDKKCSKKSDAFNTGLILAAILYANLDHKLLEQQEEEILYLWGLIDERPDFNYAKYLKDFDKNLKSKRFKRSRNKFSKSVDNALGELRVPNKEKERIEQLLIANVVIRDGQIDKNLKAKSFFKEALTFEKLVDI